MSAAEAGAGARSSSAQPQLSLGTAKPSARGCAHLAQQRGAAPEPPARGQPSFHQPGAAAEAAEPEEEAGAGWNRTVETSSSSEMERTAPVLWVLQAECGRSASSRQYANRAQEQSTVLPRFPPLQGSAGEFPKLVSLLPKTKPQVSSETGSGSGLCLYQLYQNLCGLTPAAASAPRQRQTKACMLMRQNA